MHFTYTFPLRFIYINLCTVFVFTLGGSKVTEPEALETRLRERESYEPKGSVVIHPLSSNCNSTWVV